MITRPISFFQIICSSNHIFGLDEGGEVWYRDTPSTYSYNNYVSSTGGSAAAKKADEEESKNTWKHLLMEARIGDGGDDDKDIKTRRISFMQISCNGNHLYGLDQGGEVWFRDTPPYTNYYNHSSDKSDKKDEDKSKAVWKHLRMKARIDDVYEKGEEKEIKTVEDVEVINETEIKSESEYCG